MSTPAQRYRYPDGVSFEHVDVGEGSPHRASPASLLVLGTILALAMTGLLSGGPTATKVVDSPDARLAVAIPRVLRNGVFFEANIEVLAHRDLTDVAICFPPELWRDITINTMIPAAAAETPTGNEIRFSYGRLGAGDRLELKLDAQINPNRIGATRGVVEIRDGERPLARIPVEIRVLP